MDQDPDTVTCKSLCHLMDEYGSPISTAARDYIEALPVGQTVSSQFVLFDAIAGLLDTLKIADPPCALKFVADAMHRFEPKSRLVQHRLLNIFFEVFRMPKAWSSADNNEKACYAFAYNVLTDKYLFHAPSVLAPIFSLLLDKPFDFPDSPFDWHDAFAKAIFGPVWHALYMDGCDLTDADYVELVMRQRPPLFGRYKKIEQTIELPQHLARS